jgi:hypothetical protein
LWTSPVTVWRWSWRWHTSPTSMPTQHRHLVAGSRRRARAVRNGTRSSGRDGIRLTKTAQLSHAQQILRSIAGSPLPENVFEKRGAGRPWQPGPAGSPAAAAHVRASQTHSEAEPDAVRPGDCVTCSPPQTCSSPRMPLSPDAASSRQAVEPARRHRPRAVITVLAVASDANRGTRPWRHR